MDEASNGPYSRSPELEDLLELCRSLNKQGVQYILIGGFAVILHGSVRGTKDIDLLVEPTEENIRKVKQAMAFLPDQAILLIEDDEVKKYGVVRVAMKQTFRPSDKSDVLYLEELIRISQPTKNKKTQ